MPEHGTAHRTNRTRSPSCGAATIEPGVQDQPANSHNHQAEPGQAGQRTLSFSPGRAPPARAPRPPRAARRRTRCRRATRARGWGCGWRRSPSSMAARAVEHGHVLRPVLTSARPACAPRSGEPLRRRGAGRGGARACDRLEQGSRLVDRSGPVAPALAGDVLPSRPAARPGPCHSHTHRSVSTGLGRRWVGHSARTKTNENPLFSTCSRSAFSMTQGGPGPAAWRRTGPPAPRVPGRPGSRSSPPSGGAAPWSVRPSGWCWSAAR